MKYILFMCLFLSGCGCKWKTIPNVTVTSVGGCNKYGECGVTYSDGTTGFQSLPSVGTTKEVWVCE